MMMMNRVSTSVRQMQKKGFYIHRFSQMPATSKPNQFGTNKLDLSENEDVWC